MSDNFVNAANENQGAIEALIKGLPGIKGYVDKELRRDADKRVRSIVAARLDEQKQALFNTQKKLMKQQGGLKYLDDVDSAVQKLQTLSDKIKSASYGYAGLFDPVRVREEELNALHRFDVAMAQRTVEVGEAVQALNRAIDSDEEVEAAVDNLDDVITELSNLYKKRSDALLSPDLLMEPSYPPEVEQGLLDQTTDQTTDHNTE